MYKKALVPIKHPDDVNRLAELVSIILDRGEITFLTVVQNRDFFTMQKNWRTSVNAIEKHKGSIIDRRIDVVPKIRYSDDVAQGIMDQAAEDDSDIIVLGWREEITSWRLGRSHIDRIFADSQRDVIAFKNRTEGIENIDRILFAVGYKDYDYSKRLSFVTKLVNETGAEFVMAHVRKKGGKEENVEDVFAGPKEFLKESGIEPNTKTIIAKSIDSGLIEAAKNYDLIVLGPTQQYLFSKYILMSLTEHIVSSVDCSALVFHSQ